MNFDDYENWLRSQNEMLYGLEEKSYEEYREENEYVDDGEVDWGAVEQQAPEQNFGVKIKRRIILKKEIA